MTKWLLRSMTELSSRKWISRLTGRFAHSRASRRFIPRFARIYGIRVEEAEKPLEQYTTLNEFFTRRLKPGMRIVDSAPDALVSPVDALITGLGQAREGTVLNIKGQDYSIEELLNRSPRTENYKNGYCIVLYLSPTDYHRIHVPADGTIVERERVTGKVYPVNDFGLRHMRRVLSRNERLITYIRHRGGEMAVVKVGAMNVSGIRYTDPERNEVRKGEELACFEFGSTVVLLTENGTFEPRADLRPGLKVKMGEALGRLIAADSRKTR
ncbi:archaetidylserine decarboxylase [Paenibacillus cisolokensis]|jgi:phosphatidylserine decarboxylase precursor|uniref:archaetidylserine decarboxylase n=1 Tax=Paenibacillus TaxID=44249 RepID=UPI000722B3ED|nr:archaetidylserine decarboxylase [Paenibacillus sp. 32O-W]ALS29315.1 phosphatidylserine decarboxylase [Paenibacillus sp. 32O-W]